MAVSFAVDFIKPLIVTAHSEAHVFQPRNDESALALISRMTDFHRKASVERTVEKNEAALTYVYRRVSLALFQKQIAHSVCGKAFAHRAQIQHNAVFRSVNLDGFQRLDQKIPAVFQKRKIRQLLERLYIPYVGQNALLSVVRHSDFFAVVKARRKAPQIHRSGSRRVEQPVGSLEQFPTLLQRGVSQGAYFQPFARTSRVEPRNVAVSVRRAQNAVDFVEQRPYVLQCVCHFILTRLRRIFFENFHAAISPEKIKGLKRRSIYFFPVRTSEQSKKSKNQCRQ